LSLRQKILELRAKGLGYGTIARELGITKGKVRYHLGKLHRNQTPVEEDVSQDAPKIVREVVGDTQTLSAKGRISTLEDLLVAAQVDPTEWRVSKWVANTWEGQYKGDPVPLWQVKAWLEKIPEFIRDPIKPVRHLKRKSPPKDKNKLETALIIPDSQNGYRIDKTNNTVVPLHDRKAWDLAIQVAEKLQPEIVVLLGDMIDFAPLSRFLVTPDLQFTTQHTLAELHWWLGQLRLSCPSSQIVYIEGNHEHRLTKQLAGLVSELYDLRPANDPSGHPALSVPRLLALTELDIEYIGPYGHEWWLWDKVRIHHGTKAKRGGGATVAAILREATHSEIVGHVHRLEYAARTLYGPGGARTIFAMTPGTISRCDGTVVPAATPRVDWQQGLGIVSRLPDDGIAMNTIPIQNGIAMFRGELLCGRDPVDKIKEATGLCY